MTLSDSLLLAFETYGLPALFGLVFLAALGIPLPMTLLLLVIGSLAQQGDLPLLSMAIFVGLAAVLGDQLGYAVGRWSGPHVVAGLSRRLGAAARLEQASASMTRWGGASVFLTRWLLTPLGPWLNLTCGLTRFSYPKFLAWDALGELLWATLYISLGWFFSDRVQALSETLGDITWAIFGLAAALYFAWRLRREKSDPAAQDLDLI